MRDSVNNRYKTQSLFLELGYSEDAIYTLKEQDCIYNGEVFQSIKQIYLEIADPTEYEFANIALAGWKHWQRIIDNKQIRIHVDEWREELEVKLRSQAAIGIAQQARTGSFQAAKWIADKGWDVRPAGRPSKGEIDRQTKIAQKVEDEYTADVLRLGNYK